jgi:hypothetical protein
VHQRILAVRGLGDFELAVLDLKPGPAGAELADAGRLEVGLNTAGFLPNEPLTISSRDLPSHSVPLSALLPLVT